MFLLSTKQLPNNEPESLSPLIFQILHPTGLRTNYNNNRGEGFYVLENEIHFVIVSFSINI